MLRAPVSGCGYGSCAPAVAAVRYQTARACVSRPEALLRGSQIVPKTSNSRPELAQQFAEIFFGLRIVLVLTVLTVLYIAFIRRMGVENLGYDVCPQVVQEQQLWGFHRANSLFLP